MSNESGTCRMEVEFLPLAGFNGIFVECSTIVFCKNNKEKFVSRPSLCLVSVMPPKNEKESKLCQGKHGVFSVNNQVFFYSPMNVFPPPSP